MNMSQLINYLLCKQEATTIYKKQTSRFVRLESLYCPLARIQCLARETIALISHG